MGGLFFRTSDVARELGVSQAQIRALAESGAIASESTPGGQYRISTNEVERLKRDGLPRLPRPLPDENAPPARNGRPRPSRAELLAEPSEEAVTAADEVVIVERQLAKRKVERQLEEEEEWFRERDEQKAQREAEQREAERRRQAEAVAEGQREVWENVWLAYAMRIVPYDARNEVEEEIHKLVLAALEVVRLTEPASVVQRVVDAVVARVVKPWKRRKEINEAIDDARRSLPWEMKAIVTATTWEIQARQTAARALANLGAEASYDEMRTVAREAVKPVIAAYEACKAAQANAELRQNVIRNVRLPAELDEDAREAAIQAVTEVLAQLPQGTPRHKLEQARENALRPFYDAVAKRREAEARKMQDHASRERILSCVSWKFPYGLPDDERAKATEAVRAAIAALPEGTPERAMEDARDHAIQPILDAHARRKRTAPLVEAALREILPFVQRLEADWRFDKSAAALEAELKPTIRQRLEGILVGSESSEDVGKTVRRLVRRELDIR
jgi:excisionase family DNA binding protein